MPFSFFAARLLGFVVIGLIVDGSEARAKDRIFVWNNTPFYFQVWMWNDKDHAWRQPLEYVMNQYSELPPDISPADTYYLVLRDDDQRDFHVGWIDFSKEQRENSTLELRLRELPANETITRKVWRFDPRLGRFVSEDVQDTITVYRTELYFQFSHGPAGFSCGGPNCCVQPLPCQRLHKCFMGRRRG